MADLVTDFGAVSGQDCTQAFLAAVAWSDTHPGGSLVLRRGVYLCSAPVVFSAPISIVGWGGGHGVYTTRIELSGNGRMEFGPGSGGSCITGVAVGGWTSRIVGPALTVRVPATLARVSCVTAETGLMLDGRTGNVNLVRVRDLTLSDCGVGFWADGNDANSWHVMSGSAISCDVGWRTTSVLGGPSLINCFAECPAGRGFDIQSGGGSVKMIGCYDESLLPSIVDDPAYLVGCAFYAQHIASAPPRVPAQEIAAVGDPRHLRTLQGQPGEPRVYATLGDPQSQGQVALDAFLEGDGVLTQRFQLRCPYAGANHADYWEGCIPGVSAYRIKRSDGTYPRGTVQIPGLLVGGNATTATTFGLGAVDVAAKLVDLEQRLAALESP